eukprot:7442668-Karenia_brevis.AAC.1
MTMTMTMMLMMLMMMMMMISTALLTPLPWIKAIKKCQNDPPNLQQMGAFRTKIEEVNVSATTPFSAKSRG